MYSEDRVIHLLLETKTINPAQDDEVSDELQRAIDALAEAAYAWAESNTGSNSEQGAEERQKERELKAVIAREKADLRAKLAAAESYIHDLNELLNSAVGRAVDAEARIAKGGA